MCDPYVKESFLTATPQSCRRDIEPCIVSSVDFSFIVIFVDWQKCGFSLNVSINLSTVCAHCTSNKNQHALMVFNGNRFRHTASSVQVN